MYKLSGCCIHSCAYLLKFIMTVERQNKQRLYIQNRGKIYGTVAPSKTKFPFLSLTLKPVFSTIAQETAMFVSKTKCMPV